MLNLSGNRGLPAGGISNGAVLGGRNVAQNDF
jgi:hypothetical protein